MFRKFLCILCCMLALLTFFYQGKAESTDPPGRAAASGAFSLIDGAGRNVAFKKAPQRLVVVGQGPFMPMHLLYMFPECKDRMVGYERKYKSIDTFLPLVDAQFSKKVALGTNPGPEQIIALTPDLVMMKSTTPTQLGESIATLGVPVVYLGMESPEQFLRDAIHAHAQGPLVTIARALTQETSILLMDEPTSHLDLANRRRVLQVMRVLGDMGKTILFTTHDPNAAAAVADHAIMLRGGRVLAAAPVREAFTSKNLSDTYGVEVEVIQIRNRPIVLPT